MKTRFRSEDDGWTTDGRKITASEAQDSIRLCLEDEGPIIVEHRFYRGASAPKRLVFDDMETFSEYLESQASAGDHIWVWNYSDLCRDDNPLAYGKCPDENGQVPTGGAY